MASGRHKAIVEVAGRVEGAEKDLRKLRAELGKLQKQVAKTNQQSENVPDKGLLDAASLTTIAGGVQSAYSQFKEYSKRAFQMQAANANLSIGIEQARKSTQGLVTDFELTLAANKAVSLGVAKNGNDFAKLAEAATKLGARVGQDATTSIDNLVEALGKGSTEVLDNLGVTLRQSEATKAYAAQLGIAESQLTDTQRAEAFRVIGLQKVLEKSQEVNFETETMVGGFNKLTTAVDNLIDSLFMLPEHMGGFVKEFRDFTGLQEESANAWVDWGQLAEDKLGAVAGGLVAIRGLWEDITGLQEAYATQGETAAFVKDRARSAAIEQKRADQRAIERASNLGAAGSLLADRGADTFFNVLGAASEAGKSKDKKKRGGGRGGGSRGVASSNLGSTAAIDLGTAAMDIGADVSASQIERETAALERQLEIRNMQRETAIEKAASDSERHLLTMTALEQVRTAEEEIFAKRLEAAELRGEHEEVRAIQHEQEMFRLGMQRETEAELERARREALEAERKRQAERIRMSQEWLGASKSTFNEYAQTYQVFAQAAGASEEARAKAGLRAQGIMTIGEAALSFTRALSATAVGNVPGAIAGFAGAAFGFSRGAVMLAGGVPSAQGGGGGGGGGGGPMGTTFAGGATVAPGGTNAPNSRVPGSQSGADSTPRPSSGNGAGAATQVVNVTVNNPIGDIDDEGAEKIGRALNRAGLGVMNG